jgi:FlaA1/EpsC-like NDP-sugar epimerase
MHAIRLQDLADTMIELHSGNRPIPVEKIGLRPGEKFYEELITDNEQVRCLETERLLIVLPYLKDIQVTADGQRREAGPEDYPDRPRWTRELFSSRTAVPMSRLAVRQLLRSQLQGRDAKRNS